MNGRKFYAAERQSLLRKLDDTPKTAQQDAEPPQGHLPSWTWNAETHLQTLDVCVPQTRPIALERTVNT